MRAQVQLHGKRGWFRSARISSSSWRLPHLCHWAGLSSTSKAATPYFSSAFLLQQGAGRAAEQLAQQGARVAQCGVGLGHYSTSPAWQIRRPLESSSAPQCCLCLSPAFHHFHCPWGLPPLEDGHLLPCCVNPQQLHFLKQKLVQRVHRNCTAVQSRQSISSRKQVPLCQWHGT